MTFVLLVSPSPPTPLSFASLTNLVFSTLSQNAATILALPSVIGVYPVTLVDRPTTKADLTVGVDSFAVNPTDT